MTKNYKNYIIIIILLGVIIFPTSGFSLRQKIRAITANKALIQRIVSLEAKQKHLEFQIRALIASTSYAHGRLDKVEKFH